MSFRLVEDLQKKACPKVAVSQACRILGVSRPGYYANVATLKQRLAAPLVCSASVHLKAAFAASHKAYGSRRLTTLMAERGQAMGRHKVRTLMRSMVCGRFGGASVSTPPTACTTWRYQPMCSTGGSSKLCPTGSGSAISPRPSPGQALHSHGKRLAVLGGSAGLALAKNCGLGDGRCHACGISVRGVADGHRSKKSSAWADRAFRPGYAIHWR